MQFQELYQWWQLHDLAQFRPPMYAALATADEPVFWRWMADRYLSGHREFLSLQGDIDSAGAWSIRFPGSVSRRYFLSAERLGLSAPLCQDMERWRDDHEESYQPWNRLDNLDWNEFHQRGLALAKRLKLEQGNAVYVEYWPFQEIGIVDGQALEMSVPDVMAICREQKDRP